MTSQPPRPPDALRRIVVVGAGLAATQTVGALRERGFDGHLTVVGAEHLPPYDRPPLSKHLLDRPAPTFLADELGIDVRSLADDLRLGQPARALRLEEDGVEILTTDGAPVRADAVVVATGARARRVPGWEHALVLHTADDAAVLRDRLVPGTRLVIIGAGWIGAEVAGVAAVAGVHVTVLEAADAPLTGALGADVGRLTGPWFETAGVRLVTDARVVRVDPDAVHLADGERVAADVVLAAVGAVPATGWLAGTLPLDPDGSVRVDEGYAVLGADGSTADTAPQWRVRAVGDVARRRSRRHGWVSGGHWDGALRGPLDLAAALVGDGDGPPAAEDPVPYVFSTQLGHELTLFGTPAADDDVLLRGDPASGDGWSALWFRPGSDTLTAVFTTDRPRDVGGARRLFAGAELPRLDRSLAADADVALRAAHRT
ncbi:FAD-dependent oxidoreductase [Cellulomonas edaphi]|uniref:FAD-dependent oxidoreductase n=1 Tax=Cellulomonas edaphi TaxID=3053468 RepID=A0ABT7S8H8_9CELL|nr:FAD-dependent oxidoreductase [Cellulomons edaphi]MDM7831927.1 FAD-dependent oxidoreductase [Cellulomons edaphi]